MEDMNPLELLERIRNASIEVYLKPVAKPKGTKLSPAQHAFLTENRETIIWALCEEHLQENPSPLKPTE